MSGDKFNELDTWCQDGVICPHCDNEMQEGVIDCESFPWSEDRETEMWCQSCGKPFLARVFTVTYSRVTRPLPEDV